MCVNTPIRVLHLAKQAGTIRLFMLPVCAAMRDAGAEVELACMDSGPNYAALERTGFPLHGLPRGRWTSVRHVVRLYKQLERLFATQRYDVLIAHTPVMSWIGRLAARRRVPCVVYMAHGLPFVPQQGWLKRTLLRLVEKALSRYTDAIIVMNRIDREFCDTHLLTKQPGMCFSVPGVGVAVEQFAQPLTESQTSRLDSEYDLPTDKPLLLYLGRFVKPKGVDAVLECARRVGPKAVFLLAGEGPLWQAVRDEAQRIGPHVRVRGWTDDSVELMKRCDVAVFPSVYCEGLPRFLLEAQAAGKAAVAYDVRGSADAIDDGKTGRLIPRGDVDAFCSAVEDLLADPSARAAMGQGGRERVARLFTIEASVLAQLDAAAGAMGACGIQCPWTEEIPEERC